MGDLKTTQLTPWVTRLMVLNWAVLLVLSTVFTAPRFFESLAFDPAHLTSRPWTALTYFAVQGSVLHLALTSLVLYLFGPPVERRLGGRRFLAYYLYCGFGAALFASGLNTIVRIDPFVGASGAVFGVSLAFVLAWPTAELTSFPVPAPLTARSLFAVFLLLDLMVGVLGRDGVAHFAHLGGVAAGYLFFRLLSLTSRKPPARPVPIRRPVVTPMRVQETVSELRPAPADVEQQLEVSSEELDRVLDKIARFGIDSLTSQERRFLSEASEQKRREHS
jgi:membrane associated rhomboid family serine protease